MARGDRGFQVRLKPDTTTARYASGPCVQRPALPVRCRVRQDHALRTIARCSGSRGRGQRSRATAVDDPVTDAGRAVRAALDAAKSTEPQTIDDQIRFCEVPAPPFKEAARGEVLKREFAQLGLQNVRVDRVGNVLGDRPGDGPASPIWSSPRISTPCFPKRRTSKSRGAGSCSRGRASATTAAGWRSWSRSSGR